MWENRYQEILHLVPKLEKAAIEHFLQKDDLEALIRSLQEED